MAQPIYLSIFVCKNQIKEPFPVCIQQEILLAEGQQDLTFTQRTVPCVQSAVSMENAKAKGRRIGRRPREG